MVTLILHKIGEGKGEGKGRARKQKKKNPKVQILQILILWVILANVTKALF